jgi:hypothetical protein
MARYAVFSISGHFLWKFLKPDEDGAHRVTLKQAFGGLGRFISSPRGEA